MAFDVLIQNWTNVKELQQRMFDEPGGRNTMIMAKRKVCTFSSLLLRVSYFSLPQPQIVHLNI